MKSKTLGFVFLLLVADLSAAARRIHFPPGQTSTEVMGRFTTKTHDRWFLIYASQGRHMKIEIKPLSANLTTAGTVASPSAKQDGGPGGVIFDSDLAETGDYRIHVFERQENLPGRFALHIDLH